MKSGFGLEIIACSIFDQTYPENVKKLPDEFKKGFTIFYVKNVDQLYNICFNHDANSSDFSDLEELGVEIEVHGEDEYMDKILNHEQIWEENLIEEL